MKTQFSVLSINNNNNQSNQIIVIIGANSEKQLVAKIKTALQEQFNDDIDLTMPDIFLIGKVFNTPSSGPFTFNIELVDYPNYDMKSDEVPSITESITITPAIRY